MSIDLDNLSDKLKLKTFSDIQETYRYAQKQAADFRLSRYNALGSVYQLYVLMKSKPNALKDEFQKKGIKFGENTPLLPALIKLIFDLNDSKYSARVSTYFSALKYIERMCKEEPFKDEQYENAIVLTIDIFKVVGGISAAVEEQRSYERVKVQGVVDSKTLNEFFANECKKVYASKKPIETINTATTKPAGDFVLMMGRVEENGSVDLLETLDIDPNLVFSVAKDRALKDTSSLPEALNVFADSLGFLDLFKPADKPVVTVGANFDSVQISNNRYSESSIVVEVMPKKKDLMGGFSETLSLSIEDAKWFAKYAAGPAERRQFSISQASALGSVAINRVPQ